MILKNNKRIDGCSDTVPIGTLNPFLGSTAPYGYLLCQGQKVSKITYKELYEICGDTFGQSTDTEFYLPDLRGQTVAGYKEGDSTFGTLGGLIGSLTHLHSTGNHTLAVDEIPKHGHWILALNQDSNGYNYSSDMDYDSPGSKCVIDYATTCNTDTLGWGNSVGIQMTGGNQGHTHGDTSSDSSLQPTIILNWIVKAFQLMPNQSYVENNLESNSIINSLSAAQGKALNDKITNLSKVATSGSYNDLINKPTRVDYTSKITSTYGTLNNNFNYCFLDNGMVHFNLSYTLTKALIAGQLYAIAILPTELIPKGNVICQAFSHNTCHMSAHYIRNVTGEIMIKPEKAVPIGNEINLTGDFYIK